MDVACANCSAKIKIPDQKLKGIPRGQSIAVTCPKCKNKITVDPGSSPQKKPAAPKPGAGPESRAPSETPPSQGPDSPGKEAPALGNPFDWLEEGAITALICEPDERVRGRIAAVLKSMDYQISETQTPRDALKQMRGHEFNLVALNERFGTDNPDANHVLKFLDQLLMEVRRNIFVVLFSNRFKTMDNMMAFNRSVNMIINLEDLDNLEKILQRGINENDAFFRVYRESGKKLLK
jgi:predicted Zn finger-like uncharacterized protein